MNRDEEKDEKKCRLLADLGIVGSSTALSVGLLAYGLKDSPDEVETLIQELREDGNIILDNERGYWLCRSQAEYEQWRDMVGRPRARAYIAALSRMASSAKAQWKEKQDA